MIINEGVSLLPFVLLSFIFEILTLPDFVLGKEPLIIYLSLLSLESTSFFSCCSLFGVFSTEFSSSIFSSII